MWDFEDKKLINWLKAIPIGLLPCVLFSQATAQTSVPFPCNGDIYQVQSGQLKKLDSSTGQYTNHGSKASYNYNPIGMNPNDGYIYTRTGNNIIKIDYNGTLTTGATLSQSINNTFAGDMDRSNNLIMRTSKSTLSIVNVYTGAVTLHNITGANMPASTGDISYIDSSITGGSSYILAPNSSKLVVIDLATNQAVSKSVNGYPSNEAYAGASWLDASGRFFVFRNGSGKIYEITNYLGTNPQATVVTTGLANSKNDGANCTTQPFFNTEPIAQDDSFQTPFNTSISGDLYADNGSGQDTEPNGQMLTMNTTPVSQPSHGSVTINTDGTFTYTPNAGFFGTDQFTYEISDPFGLVDTAVVTITVRKAILDAEKSVVVFDPNNEGLYALPGEDVIYTITVTNTGNLPTDTNSVFVVDKLPDEVTFYNGDIDGTGPQIDPVNLTQTNGSSINFTYATDIAYSNAALNPQSFADCTYNPALGYDSNVTYICFHPKGYIDGVTPPHYAELSFRTRID